MTWIKLLPFGISFLIGAGATVGIVQATRPVIKTEVADKTPCVCKCPEVLPCNAIDFEKIKNVRGGFTIQNHQYFVIDKDTLSLEAITQAMRKVALEQRLSRCK